MNYLAQQLHKTQADDVEDVIKAIEKSFGIRLHNQELADVNSIAEISQLICEKYKGTAQDNCTTQQVFYRFRQAYRNTQASDIAIDSNSKLTDLFPRNRRRQSLALVEKQLGVSLHMLQPPGWLLLTNALFLLASLVLLAVNPLYGVIGTGLAIAIFWIASLFENTLTVNTVGELIQQAVKHNYQQWRRLNSYNPKEVEQIIISYFVEDLDYDASQFNAQSPLY